MSKPRQQRPTTCHIARRWQSRGSNLDSKALVSFSITPDPSSSGDYPAFTSQVLCQPPLPPPPHPKVLDPEHFQTDTACDLHVGCEVLGASSTSFAESHEPRKYTGFPFSLKSPLLSQRGLLDSKRVYGKVCPSPRQAGWAT